MELPSGRAGHWFRCRQPPKTATHPREGRPSERKGRKEGREQERRTRCHTGTNVAAGRECCTATEGSSGQGLAECQLEDGRHNPFPPYLRPCDKAPTSPTAASKLGNPRTGLNDPSSAPPEPNCCTCAKSASPKMPINGLNAPGAAPRNPCCPCDKSTDDGLQGCPPEPNAPQPTCQCPKRGWPFGRTPTAVPCQAGGGQGNRTTWPPLP